MNIYFKEGMKVKSTEIIDDLIKKIIEGEMPPYSKIPSESQLSIKYDCNRHTIRKVITHLIERNYLIKDSTGGTHVMDFSSYDNHIFFISSLSAIHTQAEIKTDVHKFELITGSNIICNYLNLENESKVWSIIRSRYVNSALDHLEEIYMPYSIFPNLTKEHCEASLLSYIESQYDFKISHGIRNISAVKLTEYECKLLNLSKDSLVMQIENTGYLTNGRVYEFSLSKFRENKFTYYCRR